MKLINKITGTITDQIANCLLIRKVILEFIEDKKPILILFISFISCLIFLSIAFSPYLLVTILYITLAILTFMLGAVVYQGMSGNDINQILERKVVKYQTSSKFKTKKNKFDYIKEGKFIQEYLCADKHQFTKILKFEELDEPANWILIGKNKDPNYRYLFSFFQLIFKCDIKKLNNEFDDILLSYIQKNLILNGERAVKSNLLRNFKKWKKETDFSQDQRLYEINYALKVKK